MDYHTISDEVMQKVQSALNAGIGLALVHSTAVRDQIMEAANALDDAINGGDDVLAGDE